MCNQYAGGHVDDVSTGRLLGYALQPGASEDSAAPAERAAATANLQRLRHLLEDVSSTGEVVPADTLFRVLS